MSTLHKTEIIKDETSKIEHFNILWQAQVCVDCTLLLTSCQLQVRQHPTHAIQEQQQIFFFYSHIGGWPKAT